MGAYILSSVYRNNWKQNIMSLSSIVTLFLMWFWGSQCFDTENHSLMGYDAM